MLVKILINRVSGPQYLWLSKNYTIMELMSELLPHGMEN